MSQLTYYATYENLTEHNRTGEDSTMNTDLRKPTIHEERGILQGVRNVVAAAHMLDTGGGIPQWADGATIKDWLDREIRSVQMELDMLRTVVETVWPTDTDNERNV